MYFKENLKRDLERTFFNIEEFADMHNINGDIKMCIVDEDDLKTRSNYKTENYDGIYSHEIVLYIKASDFGEKPVYEERIDIDDHFYYVTSCSESEGLYVITLRANES